MKQNNLSLNKPKTDIARYRFLTPLFLLKLLFLGLLLKTIFSIINYPLLSSAFQQGLLRNFQLLGWSVFSEFFVICLLNLPLILLANWLRKKSPKLLSVLKWFTILANLFNLLLGLFDIFYFHFQRQRANADLLYVIKRPFDQSFGSFPLLSIISLVVLISLAFLLYRIISGFLKQKMISNEMPWTGWGIAFLLLILALFRSDLYLPAASLRNLNTQGTSIAQNSLHSFVFSVYRNKEAALPEINAREIADLQSETVPYAPDSLTKRNVVLFIMESIPSEFFTEGSKFKVEMPFMDSLVSRGIYFDEAYSFGHNSNKGITSILASVPTLTEIPLYHSAYAALPKTSIGEELDKLGYSSSFFIGDHYDDFGFAKCCNWLGIRDYFSREAIPGYEKLPSNAMGIQDEHVLNFMAKTLDTMHQPFLAINYSTSTHYPNDIPEAFSATQPERNFTPEMRSMAYYSDCIRKFISEVESKSWYKNSILIFCSDHWMYPDVRHLDNDVRGSFHIPLLIYDPLSGKGVKQHFPVSQFDILPTILGIAGQKEMISAYGQSLFLPAESRRPFIICKENNELYQVIDSSHVFGYNVAGNKAEFLYNFREDPERKKNRLSDSSSVLSFTKLIQSFLQTAVDQYRGTIH